MNRAVPFGKYLLLQRVDVGGMAEVFKGRLADSGPQGKLLAIKRILPAVAADQDFIDMFIDEGKISVELTHQNIAATYELGRIDDLYYMALEYISGRDLRAVFERSRKNGVPIPPGLAAYVVSRLAEGLDYAHRKKDKEGVPLQLIHRDISPQNILLSYDGEVKIIDFGIAKAANKILKTQAGVLKGKFGYMSPEQVRGLDMDGRSDIFSAGIILHELLTSERLFVGSSDYAVLEKVRSAAVLPTRATRTNIPQDLDAIALRALAADRDQRYQHAGELAAHLQFFLEEQDPIFAREDLAAYMKETFAAEFEHEKRENTETYATTEEPVSQSSNPSISIPEIRPNLLRGGSGSGARPRLEGGVARPSTSSPVGRIPSLTTDLDAEQPDSLTPQRLKSTSATVAIGTDETPALSIPAGAGIPKEDTRRDRGAMRPAPEPEPTEPETRVKAKPAPVREAPTPKPPPPPARTEPEIRRPPPRPVPPPPRPKGTKASMTPIFLGLVLLGAIAVAAVGLSRWRADAMEDDDGKLHIDFSPLSPPGRATLKITTIPPDAEIVIDGRLAKPGGLSPLVSDHVEANTNHDIVARRDGFHEARTTIGLKKGEVREITLTLAPGDPQITINTVPPGAHLRIDGREGGRSGGTITTLEPGKHLVHAELDCFAPAEQEITVVEGQDSTLSLNLKAMPGACAARVTAPTDPGILELVAHPAAKVFLDGKDTGRMTPLIDFPVPPGHHTLRLVVDDDARVVEIEVKPGRVLSQTVVFR